MAVYSDNAMFFGSLDGKTLNELGKLNTKLKSLEDRKGLVNEIINSTNYFLEYIEKYYKVNITTREATSEDVGVFKRLEAMATYILSCEESILMDKESKKTYVFHNQNMKKYLDREKIDINNSQGKENIVDSENVVHALLAKKKNSRKLKDQFINNKDLEREDFLGSVLRDYQLLLDKINQKLSEDQDSNWATYTRQKYLVNQDMIDAKDMILGVWGYNTDVKESQKPDLDIFDFTDYNTVKFLLSMEKPSLEFNEDMWVVWQDFINTVKESNLTDKEKMIFKCLQDGWKLKDIEAEFNIKYHTLYQTEIPRIIKKIIKVGNKYDAKDQKISKKINNRKEKE